MLASLRNNFGYKLVSLIFACLLHFYVSGQINSRPTSPILVHLAARSLPPNLILDDKDLPMVTLTLDGPPEEVARVTDSNMSAWIDLSHARAGMTTPLSVHITPLPLTLRSDVSLEYEPHTILLTLQPRRSRELPISAAGIGTPPHGSTFRSPVINPKEALVTGSRDSVNAIARLVAEADPDLLPGSVDDDFTLIALDSKGTPVSDVQVIPPTAHVRMDTVEVGSSKKLLVSPDIRGTPTLPYRFGNMEVTPRFLLVEGPPEKIAGIGTISTSPVDVTGATSDVTRQVQPILPPGVRLIETGPLTVTVHILPPPAPQLAPSLPAPSSTSP